MERFHGRRVVRRREAWGGHAGGEEVLVILVGRLLAVIRSCCHGPPGSEICEFEVLVMLLPRCFRLCRSRVVVSKSAFARQQYFVVAFFFPGSKLLATCNPRPLLSSYTLPRPAGASRTRYSWTSRSSAFSAPRGLKFSDIQQCHLQPMTWLSLLTAHVVAAVLLSVSSIATVALRLLML